VTVTELSSSIKLKEKEKHLQVRNLKKKSREKRWNFLPRNHCPSLRETTMGKGKREPGGGGARAKGKSETEGLGLLGLGSNELYFTFVLNAAPG